MVVVVPYLEASVSYQMLGIRLVGGDISCLLRLKESKEAVWRNLRETRFLFPYGGKEQHLGAKRNGNSSCTLGEKAVRAGL